MRLVPTFAGGDTSAQRIDEIEQRAQRIGGEDRLGDVLRWRPIDYGARPAFAQDRLAWTDDGRISYRLKRPWPDGRSALVLEPQAMLRRLCGIIPPPRRHLVRYHGIFGPAAAAGKRNELRRLVPAPEVERSSCPDLITAPTPASSVWRARRVPWAELLKRVFAEDILNCACGGRRSVVAVVTDAPSARALLDSLGLSHQPPVFTSRGPTELFDPSPAFEPDRPAPDD